MGDTFHQWDGLYHRFKGLSNRGAFHSYSGNGRGRWCSIRGAPYAFERVKRT